jgi:hypothetical protein
VARLRACMTKPCGAGAHGACDTEPCNKAHGRVHEQVPGSVAG